MIAKQKYLRLQAKKLLTNPILYGTIRYTEKTKEVDMIELGTKIIGNFGAMVPLSFGEVVAVETFDIGPKEDYDVKVKWENGSHSWMVIGEIDAAVGKLSGIGYYREETYYAT